ncbi:MAG: hypothetical protein EA383_09970 [Spirochaetaceae bacterium]|nr:MAG: hypothetical protein EA383_09970 [Spirochaetaceae bacterium]
MGLFQRNKTDTDEQIVLVSLLRKPRPVELQAAVQEIYLSDLSTDVKIARIRRIDGGGAAAVSGRQTTDAGPVSQHHSKYFAHNQPPARDASLPEVVNEVTKNRPKTEQPYVVVPLVRPASRAGFFRFVFRELGSILRKGASNPALRIRFFPPRVDLDPETAIHWISRIQALAGELQYVLAGSSMNGWKYLEKLEYNVLSVFALLLNEIESVDPGKHLDLPQKLYGDLKPVEDLLLVIHASDITVEALLSAIRGVADATQSKRQDIEDPVRLTEELISRHTNQLCIYGILSALHTVRSRTQVTLDDLTVPAPGRLIMDDHFICSEDVQEQIDQFLKGREERAARLGKEYQQIARVQSLVKRREDGNPDYTPLYRLLDEQNPESAILDPLRFIPLFLNRFLATYREFLTGSVELTGPGVTRLFPARAFDSEIARLELASSRLQSLRTKTGSVSHASLIDVLHARREATEPESEAAHQLAIALDAAIQVQNTLAPLTRNPALIRVIPADEQWTARNIEYYTRGEAVFPLDHDIVSPFELKGQTVAAHIQAILRVIYLFRFHYRERTLLHTLDRAQQIRQEIDEIRRDVLRIAPREEAEHIFHRVRILKALREERE